MIRFIKGSVYSFGINWVIIECYGVGYYINFAHPDVLSLGLETTIFTYQHFSEDSQSLYGFINKEELDLFEKLIEVKGLGPRTAMNILSKRSYLDIIKAIESGDITYLKSIPSLGSKTSQQIILDLKGKLVPSLEGDDKKDEVLEQAIVALKNLGYKQSEINAIYKSLANVKCENANDYLKVGLKLLSQLKVK